MYKLVSKLSSIYTFSRYLSHINVNLYLCFWSLGEGKEAFGSGQVVSSRIFLDRFVENNLNWATDDYADKNEPKEWSCGLEKHLNNKHKNVIKPCRTQGEQQSCVIMFCEFMTPINLFHIQTVMWAIVNIK